MERGPRWKWLDVGSYPIAIDDGQVFYAAQDGDYRWDPEADELQRISSGDHSVVDAQNGRVAIQPEGVGGNVTTIETDGAPVTLAGADPVSFSPDGRYVMITPGSIGGKAALYETQRGTRLETGLPAQRPVADAAFGPNGTITYALSTRPDPPDQRVDGPSIFPFPEPPFDLVTCVIATAACETVASDVAEQQPVILPD